MAPSASKVRSSTPLRGKIKGQKNRERERERERVKGKKKERERE